MWAASTSLPSRPMAPTPSASDAAVGLHGLPGVLDLLGRRGEHLVGDGDLIGMDRPLAVEAEQAGVHGRPPVALGVLVGGVGRVDGVDAGAPRRRQHLDPGEVPEVARVLADRVEVAVDPGPQRGREVAGAEDDRFEPVARPCDLARRCSSPSASSISTSRPMRLVRPSLVSSWVRSTSTHQTSRAVRALGTMSTSSDSRAPVTTSMMSPWHHGVSSPFTRTARTVRPQSQPVSAADRDAPGRLLGRPARRRPPGRGRRGRRRSGRPSRTSSRCWPAWPARSVGPGVLARLPPWSRGQMTPGRPEGGEAVGVDVEQVTEDCVVVGAQVTAEVLDRVPASRTGPPPGPARSWARGPDRRSARTSPGPRRCSSASSCSAS